MVDSGTMKSAFRCVLWVGPAALFVPSQAHALPIATSAFFLSCILSQLVVICVFLLPFLFRTTHQRLAMAGSSPAIRKAAFLLLLILLVSTVTVLDRAVKTTGASSADGGVPLSDRLRACQPVTPELAQRFDLPSGCVVLDTRPPESFGTYHLAGSCNVTPWELATRPEVARSLAALSGEVFLIGDGDAA